jgi:GTP-binding protein Era
MKKFATVSIIGMPNAGKSTLLNYILGRKISIVTYKPQTTRNLIKGILTKDECQIAFLDTPGILQGSCGIEKIMVKNIMLGIYSSDIIIVLIAVNTKDLNLSLNSIKKLLIKATSQVIFVINKIDIFSDEEIERVKEAIVLAGFQNEILLISAHRGKGIAQLITNLQDKCREQSWLYAEEEISNNSKAFMASELTREILLLVLKQELPYNLNVATDGWEESDDGKITISQIISVPKESHKAIIIGKKGSMLVNIGQKARENINQAFGIKCYLKLFITVEKR